MAEAHNVAANELAAAGPEIWLQVNESNEAAVELYKKMGYEIRSRDAEAQEVVRGAFSYSFQSTTRLCLCKTLETVSIATGPGREPETADTNASGILEGEGRLP